jgi:hypothetical protein
LAAATVVKLESIVAGVPAVKNAVPVSIIPAPFVVRVFIVILTGANDRGFNIFSMINEKIELAARALGKALYTVNVFVLELNEQVSDVLSPYISINQNTSMINLLLYLSK